MKVRLRRKTIKELIKQEKLLGPINKPLFMTKKERVMYDSTPDIWVHISTNIEIVDRG